MRRKLGLLSALVALLGFVIGGASLAGSALADNTNLMKIVPPAGAAPHGPYDEPMYPTRSLTFTIQYDDTYYVGDTIQCRLESLPPGQTFGNYGPWGSCGPPAQGACPLSECYAYTPPIGTDGQFTVYTQLVDSTGAVEGGAGLASYEFKVDTTPPDTTLSIGYLNHSGSPAGNGHHVSFSFSSDDDNATFQCALSSSTTTPSNWKACKTDVPIPFTLPLTTRIFHFSVRAVDAFGRTDPTPPSYSFSPIPCRAKLLTRARTLAALAQHGMRVRVTCLTPAAWHFFVEPVSALAKKYEIDELGGYTGLFRHAGESRTITVKAFPLRDFPPAWAHRRLKVIYETLPVAQDFEEFGGPQQIHGALAPS